jgi:thiamine pyrophosphokinase
MAGPGASDTIVVITGGDPVTVDERARVPAEALVIAADSGIEHAQALGLRVDVAVGDFDSVSAEALHRAEAQGAVLERHPAAKDATDLELALDAAVRRGAERIVVLGGHGGRVDHLLANAALLTAPAYAGSEVVAHMGGATLTVVRRAATLRGIHGEIVSLLAVDGPAVGVRTQGLLYPLDHEDLLPGATRGVSNELVADPAQVTVERGVLLVVQPGQIGTHHLNRNERP